MTNNFRMVYASQGYSPDDVMKVYAKVNRMEEGGFRVVEVNSKNQTIREFVTQHESFFKPEVVVKMKEVDATGISPTWVEI